MKWFVEIFLGEPFIIGNVNQHFGIGGAVVIEHQIGRLAESHAVADSKDVAEEVLLVEGARQEIHVGDIVAIGVAAVTLAVLLGVGHLELRGEPRRGPRSIGACIVC